MLPKVLLAAPISRYKHYILPLWLEYLKKLTYPNFDILLVDNSHDEDYYKWLLSQGYKCKHVKPKHKRNELYIAQSQEEIRYYCLHNNCDYWFSLECDVFPPVDIIQYLLAYKTKIVSASYFIGEHGKNRTPMIQTVEKNGSERQVLHANLNSAFFSWDGQLKRVFACGIGCALIHRSVLEKIKFRIDKNEKHLVHSDSYFYQDLAQLNIPVFLDTRVICKHYNSDWTKILKQEQIKQLSKQELNNLKTTKGVKIYE